MVTKQILLEALTTKAHLDDFLCLACSEANAELFRACADKEVRAAFAQNIKTDGFAKTNFANSMDEFISTTRPIVHNMITTQKVGQYQFTPESVTHSAIDVVSGKEGPMQFKRIKTFDNRYLDVTISDYSDKGISAINIHALNVDEGLVGEFFTKTGMKVSVAKESSIFHTQETYRGFFNQFRNVYVQNPLLFEYNQKVALNWVNLHKTHLEMLPNYEDLDIDQRRALEQVRDADTIRFMNAIRRKHPMQARDLF